MTPFERFKDFDRARDALWLAPGDPRLLTKIRQVWDFGRRLAKYPPPRGLWLFRSIEDAAAHREAWTAERVQRLREERSASAAPCEPPLEPLLARDEQDRRARAIHADISRILFELWDPIGLQGVGPHDEYDTFVGGVYRLLAQGATAAALDGHLRQLERDALGVKSERSRKSAVDALLALDLQLRRRSSH